MGIIDIIKNGKDVVGAAARESDQIIKLDDKTRRRYQLFLLEIYKDIKAVCDRHSIKLFVIGGSALGAIRHHGFIPWDDDIDISMTREDYEKFKGIFENDLSDKYILNAPNYSAVCYRRFPKILKKGTYYRSMADGHNEEINHISIDLFLLENTPNNKFVRTIKGYGCNFIFLVSSAVYFYENRSEEVKRFYREAGSKARADYVVKTCAGAIFSFMNSSKWFCLADKAVQWKKLTDYCCMATGRKRYLGEVMKREQWFPGVEVDFEGEKVLVFSDYDYYLRNLYHDYMVIPPEGAREVHTLCEISFTPVEKH